jgi:hypothetical protein
VATPLTGFKIEELELLTLQEDGDNLRAAGLS